MLSIMLLRTLVVLILLWGVPSWATPSRGSSKSLHPPKGLDQKIAVKLWSRTLKSGGKKYFPEMASPATSGAALSGRKVFVGTEAGIFYAVNSLNGKVLWEFKSNGPIASQPATDGSLVYFGNNQGTVYALNQETGEKAWELFIGGEILSTPGLWRGKLYFVTTSREITAIDALSGNLLWSSYIRGYEKKITMRGHASVSLSDDKIIVGFADGQLATLSAMSGAVLSSHNFSNSESLFWDMDPTAIPENGVVYIAGYFGFCMALSQPSEQVLWKTDLKSGSDFVLDGSSLYLTTEDSHAVALDKKSGKLKWDIPLYSGALSKPEIIGDYLLIGAQNNRFYILSQESGEVLEKISVSGGFLGSSTSSTLLVSKESTMKEGVLNNTNADDRMFYFLSGNGKLYAYKF